MAIDTQMTGDGTLDACLSMIRAAEYGKDARVPVAQAVTRCYELAVIRAGGPQNGVTSAAVNVHANRIRNAYFGEEVRDAIVAGLRLCYEARGASPSASASNIFSRLIEAQTGEDLKNGILRSVVFCGREVSR